jgi:hypothetical protein
MVADALFVFDRNFLLSENHPIHCSGKVGKKCGKERAVEEENSNRLGNRSIQ